MKKTWILIGVAIVAGSSVTWALGHFYPHVTLWLALPLFAIAATMVGAMVVSITLVFFGAWFLWKNRKRLQGMENGSTYRKT